MVQCIEPLIYEEQKAFIERIQLLEPKAAILAATMVKLSMADIAKLRKGCQEQLHHCMTQNLHDPKFARPKICTNVS